ncbi:MAG: hypothetical protein LBT00_04935 [Spirochaetaceae bacterium]|nr:hypothetical protein [Spirochaetaceae bacterium]
MHLTLYFTPSSLRALRHCERSEAIQGEGLPRLDCFAASRLAMTTPAPSLRASGTLPSEAIQCEGLPCLDCFAANGNYVAAPSQ